MTGILKKCLVCLLLALAACTQVTVTPTETLPPTASAVPTLTGTLTPTVTLTPAPTATATISPTPTPHPGLAFADPLLAAVAQVKPLFADDFSKNRGWISEQYDELGIKGGVVWATGKGGVFHPPQAHTFPVQKNAVIAFDLRISNASTVFATYLRHRDQRVGYQFSITGDGNWNFNGDRELASGQARIFRLGEFNHIVIIARDDQFAVLLNDKPLMYVSDSAYQKAGGFVMITFNSSVDTVAGEFDNLQLWDLDKLPKP